MTARAPSPRTACAARSRVPGVYVGVGVLLDDDGLALVLKGVTEVLGG